MHKVGVNHVSLCFMAYSTLVASAFCFLLYDIVLKADEEVGSFRHDAYRTRYDTHGSRIH